VNNILRTTASGFILLAAAACTGVSTNLPSDPAGPQLAVRLIPITTGLVTSAEFARPEKPQTSSPEGAISLEDAKRKGYDYRVGRGDVLDIYLPSLVLLSSPVPTNVGNTGTRESDRGFTVGTDGTIYLPYVGAIEVAGMTLREIQTRVIAGMSRYLKSPEVNVSVREYRSQQVLVSGAVTKAGFLPITETPLSLVGALSNAGVVNYQGSPGTVAAGASTPDLSRVVLTRKGVKHEINAQAMLKSSDLGSDWLLQDNDIVYVPSGGNAVAFVMGQVATQSMMPISPGRSTLAEVLLGAGGLKPDSAKASRVYVIRSDFVRQAKVYQLNLESVEAMVLADAFPIAERDIVYVAEAGISRWNTFLRQLLPTVQQLLTGGFLANSIN